MKRYLTKKDVIAIHKNLIDEFGGLHGVRDENLLDSSVMRPQS